MKVIVNDIKLITRFQNDTKGVFTLSDLQVLLSPKDSVTFYRRLTNLEQEGVLIRFVRGLYVTKEADLATVSQKLCPQSYISFEVVLAKHLMIGTNPKHEIKAVKVGKKRVYKSSVGTVLHLGIAKHLYFGFETIGGINFATKEKALLDTLYFYNKGVTFYFDIYSDINLSLIDNNIMNSYLTHYKNPKFIKFVNQYLKDTQ